MKLLRPSILLLALTPAVLCAQDQGQQSQSSDLPQAQQPEQPRIGRPFRGPGEPSTRPSWWRSGGFRSGSGPGDESAIRFRRGWGGGDEVHPDMPTPEQWEEVAAYMQKELPNTWRHFQNVSDGRKDEVKKQIFTKFRETQQLRERNEIELYELKLKESKLADDFSGLAREYRRAPLADRDATMDKLRAKAREITENQLAQREIRIKRLESQLQGEKDRLATARERIDRAVEIKLNDLISRIPTRRDDDGQQQRPDPKSPPVQAAPVPPPAR